MYSLTSATTNDGINRCLSIQDTIASSVYCCDLKLNGVATVKCSARKQLSVNLYMIVLGCTNGFIIEIVVSTLNSSISVSKTMLKSYRHFVNYDIHSINIHHERKQDEVAFVLTMTSSNGIVMTIPRAVSTTLVKDDDICWTIRDDDSDIKHNSASGVWKESEGSVDDEIAWLENRNIFILVHQNLTFRQSYEVSIDQEAYAILRGNTDTKESAHLVYTSSAHVDTSSVLTIFDRNDLCIYFYDSALSLEATSGHAVDEPPPMSHHSKLVIKASRIKQMLKCAQLDIFGVVFKGSRLMVYVTADSASRAILVYSLATFLLDSVRYFTYIPNSRLVCPVAPQYDTLLISDNTIYSSLGTDESMTAMSLVPCVSTEITSSSAFDLSTVMTDASTIRSNLKLLQLYAPTMLFETTTKLFQALCTHIDDVCNGEVLSLLAASLFTISIANKPLGTPFYGINNTIDGILREINRKLSNAMQIHEPSLFLKEAIHNFISFEVTVHSYFTLLLAVMHSTIEAAPTLHYLLIRQWIQYSQRNIDVEHRADSLILSLMLLKRANCPYFIALYRVELSELLYLKNQRRENFLEDTYDTLVHCASTIQSEGMHTLRVIMIKILITWARLNPSLPIAMFEQMIVNLDTSAQHSCNIYLQLILCDVLCNTSISSSSLGTGVVISGTDIECIRQLGYSNKFMLKLLEIAASNKHLMKK